MLCKECKFYNRDGKEGCTYPAFIACDEYIFEGMQIVGCARGRKKEED